jgi:hypothetical protein
MLYFQYLPIHSVFELDGKIWVKQSRRTAHIYGKPERFFYFGLDELVKWDTSK